MPETGILLTELGVFLPYINLCQSRYFSEGPISSSRCPELQVATTPRQKGTRGLGPTTVTAFTLWLDLPDLLVLEDLECMDMVGRITVSRKRAVMVMVWRFMLIYVVDNW